jgi:hypothetical protein
VAIAQAVYNATGVWVDVPMTPERVLDALKRAQGREDPFCTTPEAVPVTTPSARS